MHSWFQDSIHSKKQSQTTGSRPIPYPLESKQSNLPATPWWYKRVTLSPDQEECPNHAGTSKGSKQQQWCGKGQSSPTIGVNRMALGKRSWITHRHSSTKRSTFLSNPHSKTSQSWRWWLWSVGYTVLWFWFNSISQSDDERSKEN